MWLELIYGIMCLSSENHKINCDGGYMFFHILFPEVSALIYIESLPRINIPWTC